MHRSGGETREHGRQGCSGEGKNCYRRHPSACAEAAGGRGCGSAVKRSAVAASGSSENTASRPRKNNKVVVAAVQHKTKGAVHEDHGQARTIEVFASDINKFLGLVFTNTTAVYGEDKAVNIARHFKEQEKLLSTFFENKNKFSARDTRRPHQECRDLERELQEAARIIHPLHQVIQPGGADEDTPLSHQRSRVGGVAQGRYRTVIDMFGFRVFSRNWTWQRVSREEIRTGWETDFACREECTGAGKPESTGDKAAVETGRTPPAVITPPQAGR